MSEKSTVSSVVFPKRYRQDKLTLTIVSSVDGIRQEPISLTFFDWNELLDYYRDTYLRNWCSVNIEECVSHSSLHWLPITRHIHNDLNVPNPTEHTDISGSKPNTAQVEEKQFDLEDICKDTAPVIKDRSSRAINRINHYYKDKVHVTKTFRILDAKKKKELSEAKPSYHKKSSQKKANSYIEAHKHTILPDTSSLSSESSGCKCSTTHSNVKHRRSKYVNNSSRRLNRSRKFPKREKLLQKNAFPLVKGKSPIPNLTGIKYGYGTGLLYKYF